MDVWLYFHVPLTFALLAWATTATYRLAPPQPDRFVGADGAVLMTDADVVEMRRLFVAGGITKAALGRKYFGFPVWCRCAFSTWPTAMEAISS